MILILFITTLFSVLLPTLVSAQGWQFTTPPSAAQLPTCQSLSITLGANSKPAKAYYMISFAMDSTTITSFLGTDPEKLAYTPTHPPGTVLVLGMIDNTGAALGNAAIQYTVSAGDSTSCVDESVSDKSDFTARSNATNGAILTCDPWGIRIQGGRPPYSLTIVATDSVFLTNVTLQQNQDAFTYINRASPGSIAAGVHDSTGRWASGTPIVLTSGGTTDTRCGNALSLGGRAADLDRGAPANTSRSPSSTGTSGSPQSTSSSLPKNSSSGLNTTNIILLAVLIPGIVLLLVGVACWVTRVRRRKHRSALRYMTYANPYQPNVTEAPHQPQLAGFIPGFAPPEQSPTTIPEYLPASQSVSARSPSPQNSIMTGTVTSSTGLVRSATGTSQPSMYPSEKGYPRTPATTRSTTTTYPPTSARPSEDTRSVPDFSLLAARNGSGVIVHSDGGAAPEDIPEVPELPPPYLDRRL